MLPHPSFLYKICPAQVTSVLFYLFILAVPCAGTGALKYNFTFVMQMRTMTILPMEATGKGTKGRVAKEVLILFSKYTFSSGA